LPLASAPAGDAEKREPAPAEEEKKAGGAAETKAAPIDFRRVATGDEAISVEVLPGAKS